LEADQVAGWEDGRKCAQLGSKCGAVSIRTHLALKSLGRDVGGLDHREEPQKPRARHIDVVKDLLLPRC
jgi:hypothetical protein